MAYLQFHSTAKEFRLFFAQNLYILSKQSNNNLMSNPSCRPPLCSFNCCDKNGACPSSKDLCQGALRNPIWIYVVIGVVIILILALGVVFLVIFRRRRQKMEQKQKLAEETARDIHPVEIEMQSEEPQIVVNKPPKKNIYVYDREVVQNQAPKKNRSGTNSSKVSKSSFMSQRNVQNPFQKKSSFRSLRGNLL